MSILSRRRPPVNPRTAGKLHPLARRGPALHPFADGLLGPADRLAALSLAAEAAVAAGRASVLPGIYGRGLTTTERHTIHAARNAAECAAGEHAIDWPGDFDTIIAAGERAADRELRRVLASRPVVCRWAADRAEPVPTDADRAWHAETTPDFGMTVIHRYPSPRGLSRDVAEEMGSTRGMEDDAEDEFFQDHERMGRLVGRYAARR